jgi:iron complex outermembrane recepter protein
MKEPNTKWNRVCLVLLAGAAAAISTEARAETKSDALEEIVITSQRRTTDLQDTALSATVLSGEMLADKGVGQLYQIQYAAPSVTIASFGSANEFNIRGVGRTQVDIDVPSGVVIYRDGAPTIAGYFQTEPYYDLQSIEVLRGPQGTFVGKSAAGGAVFVNTRDPSLDALSGSVQFGGGNFAEKELTATLNVPANEQLAFRFGFNHLDSDDFYDAITGDFSGHPGERDLNSLRAALLWEPSSNFTAKIKVDYHDLDFGGNVVSSPNTPLLTVEQNGELAYKDKSARVVGDLKYDFDDGPSIRSLTAYQHLDSVNNLDVNGSDPLFYQFKSKFTVDITSQEIDLVSSEDRSLQWVFGALYYVQEADVPDWHDNGFTFTGFVFGSDYPWLTSPWKKHEDEWSVFGHLTYALTDRLEFQAGTRYSDYYTDQFTDWRFGDGLSPPTASFAPAGTQKLSEDSVDGQVGLNWTLNHDQFVYGLISRGHVTGGINIFPPFRSYDEESVLNYEFGWKANWAGNRVRTQTTLYYEDIDNLDVNFEQLAAFGVPGQDNRNAPGNSTISGIEFSLQASVENTHIDLAASYENSDIGDFPGVIDPLATAANGGVPVIVDLSGRRTPYSPQWTFNVGLAHDFLFSGYDFQPRIDVSYVDETQTKLWDSPLVKLDSRTLTNLQMVLTTPSKKWTATLWATNVFDKEYVAGIQNLASLYYAGRPREYGLRLRFNY